MTPSRQVSPPVLRGSFQNSLLTPPWSAGSDQGLPVHPVADQRGQVGLEGRAFYGPVTSRPLSDPSLPCLIGIWLVETICSIPSCFHDNQVA